MSNKRRDVMQALSMVTQLGLSIITPILLCLLAAVWLRQRLDLGYWVVIVGVLWGVASGFWNLLRFNRAASRRAQERDEED